MNNLDYARALREAADRIENLDCALDAQRRLLEKASEHVFHLRETVLKYDTMLGEADTRQRKAETDFKYGITQGDPCEICRYYKQDDHDCVVADCDCLNCEEFGCTCKDCRDMNKWEWRGAV